jgi:hypothetical protein
VAIQRIDPRGLLEAQGYTHVVTATGAGPDNPVKLTI